MIPSRLHRFAAGIRVLDLSAFLPGPYAAQILADMGANVLKVEPPGGDAMRAIGPRDAAGTPLFHAAVNAGKTVRRMDLKRPEERDRLLELVRDHDVLIEGFRPGVMDRLGLGWPVLREANPGLVYCALSGYGAGGPLEQAAGHDANYLALSGVLHRNGAAGPEFYDPPLADASGSLFAVIAILGALRAREADGRGCALDIALADTPMALQPFAVAQHGLDGTVPARRGTYLNGGAAFYQVYPVADGGHVVLGAVEPKFWAAFCAAADRPDWVARQGDALPQHALIAEVRALFAAMTRAEAAARFGAAGCCLDPVLDLGEAIASPHHAGRGVIRRGAEGRLQALLPVHVDEVPPAVRPGVRETDADGGWRDQAS